MLSRRTEQELRDLIENEEGSQTIEVQSPGGNTFTVQLTKGRADQLARSQQEQQFNQQQPQQQQQGQQSSQQQQRAQEWRIRKISQQQQSQY